MEAHAGATTVASCFTCRADRLLMSVSRPHYTDGLEVAPRLRPLHVSRRDCPDFAVSKDGKRFLALVPQAFSGEPVPRHLTDRPRSAGEAQLTNAGNGATWCLIGMSARGPYRRADFERLSSPLSVRINPTL